MEGAELSPVDIDPDFEPQARPRSCTWPLPRPELSVVTPAGTPTAEEGRTEAPPLPNEGPGATPRKGGSRRNAWGNQSYAELISQAIESSPEKRLTLAQIYDWMVRSIPYFKDKGDSNSSAGWKSSPEKRLTLPRIYDWMVRSIPYFSDKRDSQQLRRLEPPPEKRLTLAQIYDWMMRNNPYFKDKSDSNSSAGWKSSPEKRLTLAQIYDWMVRRIPYFKDKGDSNTPAGWKNSIRHNLSLHSKFIKVHNEATGKSSWWMLNPEGGKSGKAPRRRAASMDNSSKLAKARNNKVSKKKAQGPGEPPAGSPGSQSSKWPGSPSQSTDDPEVWTSFRSRTGSNASNLSLRLSPILTEQDDAADDDLHSSLSFSDSVPPTVSEELELIDGLTMLSPGAPLPAPQSMIQTPPGFSMRPAQSLPFGNSLFSPISPVSSHFPRAQTLEALLTSDSPPPSNVLMSQVDPVLAQSGGQNLLLLGGQNKIRSSEHPSIPPTPPNSLPLLGLPPLLSMPLPRPHSFPTVSERLPTDLDIDMFLENLECDVDYIINNDLMDEGGLDFNFEPLHPGNTPSNNHSWLPS